MQENLVITSANEAHIDFHRGTIKSILLSIQIIIMPVLLKRKDP